MSDHSKIINAPIPRGPKGQTLSGVDIGSLIKMREHAVSVVEKMWPQSTSKQVGEIDLLLARYNQVVSEVVEIAMFNYRMGIEAVRAGNLPQEASQDGLNRLIIENIWARLEGWSNEDMRLIMAITTQMNITDEHGLRGLPQE